MAKDIKTEEEIKKELKNLISKKEAPDWMTFAGYKTLLGGYLLTKKDSKDKIVWTETPKGMYERVAKAAAIIKGEDYKPYFEAMWKNWLCPATPVLTNMGTERGLPISCFGLDIDDTVLDISECQTEASIMSKNGGGVGIGFERVRSRGALIKNGENGTSEGIIPFAKIFDSTALAMNQGSTRRGAFSVNLDIEHGDFYEFVRIRRPEGDVNRQCPNLHHCAVVSNEFMEKIINKDKEARLRWTELMKARREIGEPYIMFKDTVNNASPKGYPEVSMTNICSEITLATDPEHSFICCLSSLNAARYDEWKDSDVVNVAVRFLNAVLDVFIQQASKIEKMEKTVASAIKGRAIGIGVLGWHSLLQKRMIAFESFPAMMLNAELFKKIHTDAIAESEELAKIDGVPEWCKQVNRRNSHLIAIAPTRSNSTISGDESPGIEPFAGAAFMDGSAKGAISRKNKYFEEVLEKHGKNDFETWKSITTNEGSVQHLSFLSETEKAVFKTAYEINQMAIIKQAAQRQKFICQAQSLNLFFLKDIDPVFFNNVHLEAWRSGVKTLYYCRGESEQKADITTRGSEDDCAACEG